MEFNSNGFNSNGLGCALRYYGVDKLLMDYLEILNMRKSPEGLWYLDPFLEYILEEILILGQEEL